MIGRRNLFRGAAALAVAAPVALASKALAAPVMSMTAGELGALQADFFEHIRRQFHEDILEAMSDLMIYGRAEITINHDQQVIGWSNHAPSR